MVKSQSKTHRQASTSGGGERTGNLEPVTDVTDTVTIETTHQSQNPHNCMEYSNKKSAVSRLSGKHVDDTDVLIMYQI